tara:strand:- start:927 stop:1247 length:321 start_codon:yes stop_codon:yes gene_type:complete
MYNIMDRKISRKHLHIMRAYVKLHFKEYYTFALRKFRKFYENLNTLEESKDLTEIEIQKYKERNLIERILEFNKTGKLEKRHYTPRPQKNKPKFEINYIYTKIIFD